MKLLKKISLIMCLSVLLGFSVYTSSLTTTKGTTYTYEFWKPTAIGYVVGSASITY